MCRSIKRLREGSAPASPEEIRSAALQYVRKVSGFQNPAEHNVAVFSQAVEDVAAATRSLLGGLVIRGAG